ncbi:MAG TPA: metalloregulator ArsR/SmtB family transcription factor [Vicingaceae bacterium]|jgi:DNA-binding transcriptional ArsR family regulator|nr:metalloregulator ArsR/SmtB family transcription factor [Vicingaceae bacterium]
MSNKLTKLYQASEMLKAIAHPIRLAIVQLLENNQRKSVTEIHETLKIEQAVASHHLSILKNKGVVSMDKEGKHCYYYLKHQRLAEIVVCVNKCQE